MLMGNNLRYSAMCKTSLQDWIGLTGTRAAAATEPLQNSQITAIAVTSEASNPGPYTGLSSGTGHAAAVPCTRRVSPGSRREVESRGEAVPISRRTG